MQIHLRYLFITMTLYLSVNKVSAQQSTPINDSLYSNALKEKRNIQVFLPPDYKTGSSEKYDVTYVLDGEWNAPITVQLSQYLSKEGLIPPNIIVSIPNIYIKGANMRDRDFTPVHVADPPFSGGADSFLLFLKTELLPYINQKYPSTGKNMIFGQSLGGLFGMYALLKEPSVFQSYLLADPSFWYNDRYMVKLANDILSILKNQETALWITGRKGGPISEMGIDAMDSVLKIRAPAGLHWNVLAAANETHTSTQIKTLYDGLKFAYQGYQNSNIDIVPSAGVVFPGKSFQIRNSNEFLDNTYYTTDGSEPTVNSEKMQNEVTLILQKSSKLLIKSFCNRPEYNQVISANFDTGISLSPIAKPKNIKPGGLKYLYYEGTWGQLPDFTKLKGGVTEFLGNDYLLKSPSGKTDALYLMSGYLEIKQDGYHTFEMIGGDSANFFLGEKLLISKSFRGDKAPNSYIIPLKKGFYPIKLELLRKNVSNFILIYNPPGSGGNFMPLPISLLYSKN